MKKDDLYYEPPSNQVFEEMKRLAIEIWNTYSDEFGYRSEKVDKIKDLENAGDNFMYIFAMFDHINQSKLIASASSELKKEILDRLPDGYLLQPGMIFKTTKELNNKKMNNTKIIEGIRRILLKYGANTKIYINVLEATARILNEELEDINKKLK